MWQFHFTAASYFPGGKKESEFARDNDYMRVKAGDYLLFRRWEYMDGYSGYGEPRLMSFFFAKIRGITLPKSGFFSGERPGDLQVELPNGKIISTKDHKAVDTAFEEYRLPGGMLHYLDHWSAFAFDSHAELAATMDELNGDRRKAEIGAERYREEMRRKLEAQRRAEQEKEAARLRPYAGTTEADLERRFRGK